MASPTNSSCSPLGAAVRGAAAGLAATLMLSALSRVLPGMGLDPKLGDSRRDSAQPPPPRDPFNAGQVEEWQRRSQAPAAFRQMTRRVADNAPQATLLRLKSSAPMNSGAITPASALEQPQSPGPEGLAEQFAFKVGSALFGVDISPIKKPVGMATHLTYGSLWGAVYGLVRAGARRPPAVLGALFGLGVWAIGPATLVPAMRLMGKPTEEPPARTAMMLLGHAAYGAALAEVFELEMRA